MARPTLFTNRKLPRLARAAGVRITEALGLLEFLWHAQYEACDETIGDALDVEALARWEGEPGVLAAALVTSGLVDRKDDGTHVVHDFWDHAPEYVRRRRERENERCARGLTLSEMRAEAGRKGAETTNARRHAESATNRQTDGKRTTLAGHESATDRQLTGKLPPLPAPSTQLPSPRKERESVAGGATRAPKAPLNGRPSLDEWVAKGRAAFPDWPEDDLQGAFTFAGSEGKLHAKGWEAMLTRLHAAYVRREGGLAKTPSPHDREKAEIKRTIQKAKGIHIPAPGA